MTVKLLPADLIVLIPAPERRAALSTTLTQSTLPLESVKVLLPVNDKLSTKVLFIEKTWLAFNKLVNRARVIKSLGVTTTSILLPESGTTFAPLLTNALNSDKLI